MAHTFLNAQQLNPARVAEGKDIEQRATRDGAGYTIPWLQALSLEGRLFGVQFGSANKDIVTVGTFGAGATDLDEFDMLCQVPATVGVIPVYFKVGYVALGTGVQHTSLVWGNTGIINATNIACVPYNMRPGSSNVSACTVNGLGNDAGTAMVVDGVIFQEASTALTGVDATVAQLGYEWNVETASYLPVIEGLTSPARIIAAFASAVGGTGFLNYIWVELPISAFE